MASHFGRRSTVKSSSLSGVLGWLEHPEQGQAGNVPDIRA